MLLLPGGCYVPTALPVRFTPLRKCASTVCHGTRSTVFNKVSACCAPFVQLSGKAFQGESIQSVRPKAGRIPRLVPRLVKRRRRGIRAVLSLFARGKCGRMSVGVKYPFPVLTGHRGNSNVLPFPRRMRGLLRVARECPRVDFSIGVHLK